MMSWVVRIFCDCRKWCAHASIGPFGSIGEAEATISSLGWVRTQTGAHLDPECASKLSATQANSLRPLAPEDPAEQVPREPHGTP